MNGKASCIARGYVIDPRCALADLQLDQIHTEFGQLFAMKILIFVEELISVVLTPFVLWFSLPGCAPAVVDFFREFTVHVDGRGYVCSFAEFNFERHGNVKVSSGTSRCGLY
jgi:autophagy-related protein 9